jgi:hypothetical protein
MVYYESNWTTFGLCAPSNIKNTTFRRPDLPPSSGVGNGNTYSFGSDGES